MRRLRLRSASLVALALAASCTDDIPTAPNPSGARPLLDVSAAAADPVSFCSPATITITQSGAATPYPSLIAVSGISSGPVRITATLPSTISSPNTPRGSPSRTRHPW